MEPVKERKFKKLISQEHSKWLVEATTREKNQDWLNRSFLIAMKVLRTLRVKKLTQVWLADELQVSPQQISKIIKGSENLTLETICKIELALGITLIEIPDSYGNVIAAAKKHILLNTYQKSDQRVTKTVEAKSSYSSATTICSQSNLHIVPEAA